MCKDAPEAAKADSTSVDVSGPGLAHSLWEQLLLAQADAAQGAEAAGSFAPLWKFPPREL